MSYINTGINKLFIVLIGTILICSCASLGGTKSTTPYNPTFQNELPEQANKGGQDITIALLEPSYAFAGAYNGRPTSTNVYKYQLAESNFGPQFQEAMVSDFQETVNKKGFLLKGPFADYDRMVYSDRKNSDLVLGAKINIYPVVTDLNYKKILYPNGYKIDNSTAKLGGQMTLEIYEPMTRTKLWTRSIPIPDNTFSFKGEKIYVKKIGIVLMDQETQFRNGMAKALENAYSDFFDTIYRYMDVREMQQLKKQGLEVRSKAGFDAAQ